MITVGSIYLYSFQEVNDWREPLVFSGTNGCNFVIHIELFRPLMRDAPILLKSKFRQTSFEHKILPKNVQMPLEIVGCMFLKDVQTSCFFHGAGIVNENGMPFNFGVIVPHGLKIIRAPEVLHGNSQADRFPVVWKLEIETG